jgi:hypothetical protein
VLCGCASQNAQKSQGAMTKSRPLPRDPEIEAYVGAIRAELSEGKVGIINKVMNLSTAEGKVFWPIYEAYESELFDLGDQRVDLLRKLEAAGASSKLDPRQLNELAEGYFKFQQDQVALTKKYYDMIASELSPVRAAQFAQIEHRIGTVVDLVIAAETPMIANPAPAAR